MAEFAFGIPVSWVSEFDEAYYNGRRRDIHDHPIGTEYREGDFRAWRRARTIHRGSRRRPVTSIGMGC